MYCVYIKKKKTAFVGVVVGNERPLTPTEPEGAEKLLLFLLLATPIVMCTVRLLSELIDAFCREGRKLGRGLAG